MTDNEDLFSETTEILSIKNQKWIKGPNLPRGIGKPACVSLPPITNFACVIVGGAIKGKTSLGASSSDIYGLNKTLTEWTYLGKIRKEEHWPIALPLS